MNRFTKPNPNPQKHEPLNIAGFLDSTKLYKEDKTPKNLPPKSKKNNQRTSPGSTKLNNRSYRQETQQPSILTGRNTIFSQNYKTGVGQQSFDGYYTARNQKSKQRDQRVRFVVQPQVSLSVKKQRVSIPRNRFYYKEEYDQQITGDERQVGSRFEQFNEKQRKYLFSGDNSKNQRILTSYLTRINRPSIVRPQPHLQYNNRSSRSRSPLEQSHNHLFNKCYQQTRSHLHLMLSEIHSSQQQLQKIHSQIINQVFTEINKRASLLRDELMDLVEEIVCQWEKEERRFVKENQILFLDELLEVKEQLGEREEHVKGLVGRLQEERREIEEEENSGFDISGGSSRQRRSMKLGASRAESVRKSVTADLLMFNYENTIIQLQQLIEKISFSIDQKCNKAICSLPSSQSMLNKRSHFQEILDTGSRSWLKNEILAFIFPKEMQKNTDVKNRKLLHEQRQDSNFTLSQFRFDNHQK